MDLSPFIVFLEMTNNDNEWQTMTNNDKEWQKVIVWYIFL